jgi:hypothetical protein
MLAKEYAKLDWIPPPELPERNWRESPSETLNVSVPTTVLNVDVGPVTVTLPLGLHPPVHSSDVQMKVAGDPPV